jgi:excisionase family DNA binding protein
MHEEKERWVTVSVAARHFRVSRNTIYEACREKELACMRVRSLFRVRVIADEEYLTVAETAEILNISTSTVYEACSGAGSPGQIPHIRIRSRIRIPRSQLMGLEKPGNLDVESFTQGGAQASLAIGLESFNHGFLNAFDALS